VREAEEALPRQLGLAVGAARKLSSELVAANRELMKVRSQVTQEEIHIADRDGRIAQLVRDIEQAYDELHALAAQHDVDLKCIAAQQAQYAAAQGVLGEQVQQIETLLQKLDASREECERLRRELHDLTAPPSELAARIPIELAT